MSYVIRTILYATDLGPHSREALKHAVGIAQRFGAKMHIVSVVSRDPMKGGDYIPPMIESYVPAQLYEQARQENLKQIQTRIDEGFERFADENPGLDARPLVGGVQVIEGDPTAVILAEAKRLGAELIVLGSHGHSALGEMLLGSVAHKVTIKSPVPVLLVPLNP